MGVNGDRVRGVVVCEVRGDAKRDRALTQACHTIVGVASGRGLRNAKLSRDLREGEVVVISGNFLVAAESRIKSAAGKF